MQLYETFYFRISYAKMTVVIMQGANHLKCTMLYSACDKQVKSGTVLVFKA